MKNIRTRLGIDADHEAGMTLVEVIVAMVIFAIISTGVIYSMISVIGLTRDSRSIQVASNLAAEEIDLARGEADLFLLVDQTKTVVLNGDNFRVARTTNWISDPTLDLKCGSGGGALRYKRVDVTVTWDNMASPASAVSNYTVIDPKSRINDPAKGTILVSVLSFTGAGVDGVKVTATPSSPANGATVLTTAPALSDGQGCTYILKVEPGNYDVQIEKNDYVDENQVSKPIKIVGVGAGSTSTASFTYDSSTEVEAKYADKGDFFKTDLKGAAYDLDDDAVRKANKDRIKEVKIPTNLDTSFLSTYPTFVSTATNDDKTRKIKVLPIGSGYTVLAGKHVAPSEASAGCEAVDPEAWPNQLVNGYYLTGVRPTAIETPPGGSVKVDVPMGYVEVFGGLLQYLKAVSVDGSPRCEVGMTYDFGKVLKDKPTESVVIGLPYGTWKLYVGLSVAGATIDLPLASATVLSRGSVQPMGLSTTVTLDPRQVAP